MYGIEEVGLFSSEGGRTTKGAKGFVDSVTIVGTKVGQWTVRPAIKTYDYVKGKKRK
jgi:hypothetical protein